MADYTSAEPLPWSDFHIARAQALRDFYRGHDRENTFETLHELKHQAEHAGLKIALPRIEAALGEVG